MTEKEWLEDINFLIKTLENTHPNLYRNYDKTDFYKKIEEIQNKADKTEKSLYQELATLLPKFKDAHTQINWWGLGFVTPLLFKIIDEKVYVVVAREVHKDVLFKEIIAINDIPINNFLKKLEKTISYETVAYKNHNLAIRLNNPYFLEKAGLITGDIYKVSYDNNGEEKSLSFKYKDKKGCSDLIFPLDLEKETPENYIYKCLENEKTLYIRYRRCRETENYSMQDFVDDIDKLDFDYKKIIVDIRNNPGGNSDVMKPLIVKLQEITEERELITLINEGVFSSGTFSLVNLKNIGSIIVGTETGGAKGPRFGNVVNFELPNSKIKFICSTKKFCTNKENDKLFITGEGDFDTRPTFPMESYKPDIYVKNNIEDYKKHEDAVLKFALQYKKTDI